MISIDCRRNTCRRGAFGKPGKLDIAPMRKKDLARIFKIEQETISGWTRSQLEEELLQPAGFQYTVRISTTTEIVAFLHGRLVDSEAEILKLAVAKRFRRQHIGDRLLKYSLNRLRQQGVKCCFLECRATNIAAQGIYAKNGFTTTGVRKGYYSGPSEDAVLMMKKF
jgi:ribosomal-protein-alanine N-acetyltransferase